MRKARPVDKKLRKFLGLWWIEPIDETIKDLGLVPYRHVRRKPLPGMPSAFESNTQPTGS
jgi:hypothetical protein